MINPKFGISTTTQSLTEIALSFNPPKPKEIAPAAIRPVFAKPAAPAILPPTIPESGPSELPSVAAPDVTGIGRSLFNCDLANSKNLSREQRPNCFNFGLAPPPNGTMEAGMPKTSRTKNGALWAAELKARQTPVRVPCTSIQQEVFGGPGLQKQTSTLMADPLCLLNGILNSFQAQAK